MSTEPTANPAEAPASTPAADAGANGAPEDNDDFSTEEFDRAPAPEGEDDDGDPEGEADGEGEPSGKAKPSADDDLAEIELDDGSKVKVPKAAAAGFLKEQDYRQKTMKLAEERRALETERQTYAAQQEESRAALPEEYAKVAIVSRDVAQAQADVGELEKIDWATWRAQTVHLADDDPNKVQYKQYRAAYDAARETLSDAQRNLTAAKEDLTTKEKARLEAQASARETELATARQATGEALKSEGWDQQRFQDVALFAVSDLGVRPEELPEIVDPRLWRLIDRLKSTQADNDKLRKSAQQNRTAAENQRAQTSKPAESAKGSAQPTRVRDDVGTATWMERRNRQVAARQGKR